MVNLTTRPTKFLHMGVTLALGVTLFLAGPAGAQGVSLEALSAQVAALQQTVLTLQGEVNALQNVQALDPFVSVDPNPRAGVAGPHIIFSGANIHVVSGSGATNDNGTPRGLGNLIIGYDEDPAQVGSPLNPGDRGGSHNVVIGASHKFTQAAFGGLVAGARNTISNTAASVSGGLNNTASGETASVSGGFGNEASGNFASVSGGFGNEASGVLASVSGGLNNTASGGSASVSGGRDNEASGDNASVSGGFSNEASGVLASVSGGENNGATGRVSSVSGGFGNGARGETASISGGGNNDATGVASSVSGGFFNTASGFSSSVSGGTNNTARGDVGVVIGGQNVVGDPFTGSIDPQPPFP